MPINRTLANYIASNPSTASTSRASGVWTLDEHGSALAQNTWPVPPNIIQRSLRFNRADTPYLTRTLATAGNRTTWTWSGWVKRCQLDTYHAIFVQGNSYIYFNSNNKIEINLRNSATNYFLITTQVYRDPLAWYHIVVVLDTNNGSAADRLILYVNGTRVTTYEFNTYQNISSGYEPLINSAAAHSISINGTDAFNGYMTEINFVDGQALAPTLFGETDPQTGVWIPKPYVGTYGTNGFRLNFSNNSSTTPLGYDSSGNGNNWTPNNFSVTPGTGNDSLVDVPSLYGVDTGLGGEVRGNYCTFNPINSSTSLLNGNLDVSAVSCSFSSTMNFSSGKWYFEFTKNANGDNQLGIVTGNAISATGGGTLMFRRMWRDGSGSPSWVSDNATVGAGTPVSASVGDIISVALDLDNNAVYFAKNNIWMNGGIPTSGSAKSGAIWTDLGTYSNWGVYAGAASTGVYASLNTGQRPFVYQAPTGYKALCTTNLSAPAVGQTSDNQADNHFQAVIYSGNGSTQSITTEFAPDFVWIKNRTGANSHILVDAIRGAGKGLSTESTTAEYNIPTAFQSFNQNGFTVGYDGSNITNATSNNYVAWCWNAGGTTVTNTTGTISAQVRANPASGFSIVTYTGTGTSASFGHGLGKAPNFVIIKSRGIEDWFVYASALGGLPPNYVKLNTTSISGSSSGVFPSVPTNTVVNIGSSSGVGANGVNHVAYCFAEVPGFSAFGSYVGNGSTDGPFVYLGFKPAFILIKPTSQAYGWWILDNKRNPTNRVNLILQPNLTNAESSATGSGPIDFLSNGFKVRDATYDEINASTRNYMYAAFAEHPTRLATAR
jgi:hypothetical protein